MPRDPRVALVLALLAACASATPSARVVSSSVDRDDGAFDVTVRLPGLVRRGSTVEVFVLVVGRRSMETYEEGAIDFSIGGRGLTNARVTPIGGSVVTPGFLGEGGMLLARRHGFGAGSKLGFSARFDIAADAPVRELHFQVDAAASSGNGMRSKRFVRNYAARVE